MTDSSDFKTYISKLVVEQANEALATKKFRYPIEVTSVNVDSFRGLVTVGESHSEVELFGEFIPRVSDDEQVVLSGLKIYIAVGETSHAIAPLTLNLFDLNSLTEQIRERFPYDRFAQELANEKADREFDRWVDRKSDEEG